MKHLIVLFALFCAFSVSAQIAEDTTYFAKENGQWFKIRSIQYANKNRNLNYEFIGDSVALFNSNLNTTGQRVADMAVEVQSTANFTKELNQITTTNTQVRTASGKNYLDTLYSQNKDWYLQGTWVMRGEDSGTFVFSETAAGQLRYSYNGGTIRNATPYGKQAVILAGYPTAGKTTIFWYNGKNWMQRADAKLRLVRTAPTSRK